ncbi:unnamed protein product [Notodromas monacha]|uniref:Mitochondrial pyruvate carrier n=1 Tax=Notodromas monacha TaxID=399045 RepID=A0A7R9BXX2_9CRUS|nr:unnamed protein product [Notodromas monacha]CAG0922855.1 unnamed protein product [Notodromas monacha]
MRKKSDHGLMVEPGSWDAEAMKGLYWSLIKRADLLVPHKYHAVWNHPAGPKTIHFWAPLAKWGLVGAGLGDMARPAEKLSINQSGALTATGFIWSRYSLVITPKNWSLFAVNFFVGLTGLYQVVRIYRYNQSKKTEV